MLKCVRKIAANPQHQYFFPRNTISPLASQLYENSYITGDCKRVNIKLAKQVNDVIKPKPANHLYSAVETAVRT